jgi:hypothetical protein
MLHIPLGRSPKCRPPARRRCCAQEANPPAEVLRVAMREFKRLQRGSEQHPGYAMSLAYLETLAELPWDRWSHQLPPAPAPRQQAQQGGEPAGDAEEGPEWQQGAAGRDDAGGDGAAAGGAAVAGAERVGQLSLREVRERLDVAHYGLDKIKDRIVQVRLPGEFLTFWIIC